MDDIQYIIEILLKARDEARPKIAALKAEIDKLKGSQDADRAVQDLGKSVEDLGDKSDDTRKSHEARRIEEEKGRRVSEDAGRGARSLSEDLDRSRRSADAHSESMSGASDEVRKFHEDVSAGKKARESLSSDLEDIDTRASKLGTSWKNFENVLNSGSLSKGEASIKLKQYASEMRGLARETEVGSDAFKDLAKNVKDADSYLGRYKFGSYGGSTNFLDALKEKNVGSVLENIGSKFDDLGLRITGVSSFLRGFFDLAKIGFSQQLITGITSLAGGLFSVAAGAAQAGAALAGAFISGVGQAIPMLAIVAASLERFKNILQAVSVAGQAEQQKFYDPSEKQVLQLQQTSQLISSNQQLSNSYIQLFEAQQRVRDSQISLTEARYTAQRQITELADAEKNARLEAEGANLSLTEAKRQLQIAIQKGDAAGLQQAELAVKEAELSKRTAEYAIPKAEREARLAKERGVSGAPSVISAVEGLEGSKVAVLQAQQAGEAAKRQAQITQLQEQARSSKETQYESQLKFLEKGMSPTELGLTDALIGIEKELKSPDSPLKKITDYFVEPFTNAVERIRSLLKNADFLGPLDELAKTMGAGLGRLEKTTYGEEGTNFFVAMAKDATSNIPVVSQAIERIMKLFEDVAKAADPAFHRLSEDWDRFWGVLDKKYEGEGLEKLTEFFSKSAEYAEKFASLGKALFDLFKAIGSDAAPQGLDTVTSFTGAVKDATEWVQSHGPEVTKFFKEAREGLSLIGQLLFGIGKSLIEVFSLGSIKAFNSFIQQIILPALRDVVNILGWITTALLKIANAIPGGKATLEAIAALFLSIEALGKISAPLIKTIALFKELRLAVIATSIVMGEMGVVGAITNIGTAVKAVISQFKLLKSTAVETAGVVEATSVTEVDAISSVTAAETGAVGGEAALGAGGAGGLLGGAGKFLGIAGLTVGGVALGDELTSGLGQSSYQGIPTSGGFVNSVGRDFHKQLENIDITKNPLTAGVNVVGDLTGVSDLSEKLFGGPSSSEDKIRNFGDQVEKLKGKLSSLPNSKLEAIQHEAESLAQNPALEKYKGSLEGIAKSFNPSEIAAKKWSENLKEYMNSLNPVVKNVAESFNSIKESTQFIFKQVKETVKTNIESIKEDLGTNSKLGKEALAKNFGEAETSIYEAIGKGTVTTKKGMGEIRRLVSEALKKYGVNDAEIESSRNASHDSHVPHDVPGHGGPGYASGGYISAQSGGRLARVGEGGHDEVVLSTDPAHAQRSRQLLGQFFSQAPHMASGGFVADPGTNFTVGQEPKLVTELRRLGEYLGTTIYGISGYRTPQQSVAAGGFSNDPHTRGEAVDIGVGSQLRESASRLNATLLKKFDLYRPFYPASAAEINHLQLIPGDASTVSGSSAFGSASAVGSLGHTLASIMSPKVKGGGVLGNVVQAALDISTKAANIFLSKQSSSGEASISGSIGTNWSGTWVKVMEQIAKAKNWSLAAWRSVIQRESGGNPNALGSPTIAGSNAKGLSRAYGLGQFLGSTYTEYSKYGADSTNPVKQIEAMAQYINNDYGDPTNALHSEESRGYYDVGGIVAPHKILIRHLRKKLLKFAFGGRAPWGGGPVPIIAHEGERIMNPAQYHETARLAGTSPGGLDRHLGYDGSPRQNFADGGLVVKNPGGTAQPITEGAFESSLSSQFEIGTLSKIAKIFKTIKKGFKKLKDITKKDYNEELTKYINEIIIESSGVLARLQEGREFFKAKLERKSVEGEYKKSDGKIKLGTKGEVGIAEAQAKNLAEESKYLQQERQIVDKTIAETKRLKPSNARTTALHTLAIKQKELGEVIDQNIEARYQAEVQALQDRITKANTEYQTISQEQTTSVSGAQALGQLGQVGGIEQQIKKSAESQLNTLAPLLKQAESIGNTELAATIKQEMSSLRQTITNSIVETITNAQTLIQRESGLAESKTSMLQAYSKVASQEGRYSQAGQLEKQALEGKGQSLLSSRSAEEKLKEEAAQAGDTAAVISLTEEINKNNAEIAENNLALKENAVVTRELVLNQIEATGQFKTGVYGAATQGLETLGNITGYHNVGGLLLAAKGREGSLGTERNELEGQAAGIGLGVEGMTPAQILSYLASPEGQTKLSQLEKGEDKGEKEQMYKLVDALETNATNTLKNAEEIAKLNGQLNQPQSWSTQAWQQFRGAFFNGMGGLLPQYSSILPPGSQPMEMPKYGEMAPGASRAGSTIGTMNITHPVERLDPVLLGEQMSHIIATTPTMQ